MSLFRLVYASTSLLSDEPDVAREQIEQILLVSRRNNEAAEITGALLFSDTNFSQVLEGPRAEVECLYETLNHDLAGAAFTTVALLGLAAIQRFSPTVGQAHKS